MLDIHLFGHLRLFIDREPVKLSMRPRTIPLLSYLLLHRSASVPRDMLAFLLWPDVSESEAQANLRRHLYELRGILAAAPSQDQWILSSKSTLQWNPTAEYWLDVAEFERLSALPGHLAESIAYYTGDLLTNIYEDWVFPEQERLRNLFFRNLAKLAQQSRARRDFPQAIAYFKQMLAYDPLREDAIRELISLRYQMGDRAGAIQEYHTFERHLKEQLGVTPMAETVALLQNVVQGTLVMAAEATAQWADTAIMPARAALPKPETPTNLLPGQLNCFIGRERETADVRHLLLDQGSGRLVSLIGPGGIGKTQLALAVAASVLDAFPHGVYFVPLASLSAANQVTAALAESMGLHFYGTDEPAQQLVNHLRPKQMLLVLDNFEHILPAAELVDAILLAASGVKILVTSRERLNWSHEVVYRLGGMPYPEWATPLAGWNEVQLANYDALKLLLQCACSTRPDFSPRPLDFQAMIRICQLTHGTPLALVLAAGWLEVLSFQEIAAEISQGTDILMSEAPDLPERHRSMRAVFDYSWRKLVAADQQAFKKLSVFRGAFSRQAAQSVTGVSLLTLRRLVNKSFLTLDQENCFAVHELLRQYGAEHLARSGEAEKTGQAHSDYYLALLHQHEAGLRGGNQLEALNEIAANFDNITAAWEWAVQRQSFSSINSAIEGLHFFFDMRVRQKEGAAFFRCHYEQLEQAAGAEAALVRARLLARHSFLHLVSTAQPGAGIAAQVEECLAVAEQQNEAAEVAFCLGLLGVYKVFIAGDISGGVELLEQSHARHRVLGDSFFASAMLGWLAIAYYQHQLGDFTDLLERIRESLAEARQQDNRIRISFTLVNLAEFVIPRGEYENAAAYVEEALAVAQSMDLRVPIIQGRMLAAFLALFRGDMATAAAVGREALTMANEIRYAILTAFASAVLALVHGVDGDYVSSRRLGEESLAIPANHGVGIIWANWALALSHCNQRQYDQAWSYLQVALRAIPLHGSLPSTKWLLPVAAVILAHTGREEAAVELLALVAGDPISTTGWMSKWSLLVDLQARLQTEMDPDIFAAAWNRGRSLDLQLTVNRLIADQEAATVSTG
jgi:DNA-binding SARP family transcriptional activator/predicted ATPase